MIRFLRTLFFLPMLVFAGCGANPPAVTAPAPASSLDACLEDQAGNVLGVVTSGAWADPASLAAFGATAMVKAAVDPNCDAALKAELSKL